MIYRIDLRFVRVSMPGRATTAIGEHLTKSICLRSAATVTVQALEYPVHADSLAILALPTVKFNTGQQIFCLVTSENLHSGYQTKPATHAANFPTQ